MLKNFQKVAAIAFAVALCYFVPAKADAQIPMGMNIGGVNYWSPIIFTDAMKNSGPLMTFSTSSTAWDTQKMASMPVDANGYPLKLPVDIDGMPQSVRFLINSYYSGDYVFLFDGKGIYNINNIAQKDINGFKHIYLDGIFKNIWVNITYSDPADPMRNFRVIPAQYLSNEQNMPEFRDDFLSGLKPFHVLRFMDFTYTNNSPVSQWEERTKKTSFTQGSGKGAAWEYAIDIANQLDEDLWINVPHKASDDYIYQLATLLKNNVKPNLKIYIEFSNEMWNWGFPQSQYILNYAPGHPNAYVSADLAALKASGSDFPEMDAYMMARMFRIFGQVWGTPNSRIVRVATGQHAWYGNSGRILNYLFKTNGIGADALSVGGYFSFNSADHNVWNAMDPASVTPEMILQSANSIFDTNTAAWTRGSAAYAKQYGIDYLVYEGGQHMQPYNQGDWAYNHAVYDAQIQPGMYDLYARDFNLHQEAGVNCKLFMAFSYVGARVSRWGSWGHLENYSQLNSPATLRTAAPKYQALLDFNTPKTANSRADVNNSSNITSADALLTMRYALGLSMAGTAWQAGATTGDVNCDGIVTSSDALLIMRYSLGLSMSGTAWCAN